MCPGQGKEVEEVEAQGVREELVKHVVQPIEAVIVGLKKDTVPWHGGLLSVPKVYSIAESQILQSPSIHP